MKGLMLEWLDRSIDLPAPPIYNAACVVDPTSMAKPTMAFFNKELQRRVLLARLIHSAVVGLFLAAPVVAEESSIAEQSDHPISFVNDVVPVLTKAGCNGGTCHAKAGGGQNGFELSLFGFEPAEDFDHLTRDGRGRRLFFSSPDQSLLLLKASGRVPHGGGVRLEPDSDGYRRIRKWIEQNTPDTSASDPVLDSVEVQPARGTLEMLGQQQLKALANYSDGSVRDVTELTLFESNDSAMAEVTDSGLVSAMEIPGKVAVMVRYQGKVSVYGGIIPLGAPLEDDIERKSFVDQFVFRNLREIGIPPSPVCDDATFLRRVSLDIAGRLPTDEESEDFFASDKADRREQLIASLLSSPGYADYFANKWTSLLKNRRDDAADITSNFAFHAWIRDSLLANTPYDQIVRELLAATGTVISNPSVAWYKRVKDPKQQIEDVAQLFLGVRLQCAQCHHHPFERWSQDDYYSLSAFFSQIGRKPTSTPKEDLIFHRRGIATAKNVRTGKLLKPAALGDSVGEIGAGEDPRLRLADWMSGRENPFFAKALVNRYWKHFFKRGLIEPEDDIRDSNPPTNPELLSALENHFVESGFDLKELVRVITNSDAYQLSAVPNEHNRVDLQNYSRYYPKRLQAEVLLDAIDQLTGATTSFANLPTGTRAIALPDNSYNKASPFLKVFGRPDAASVCECERVQSANLAQSLHMMNAADIKAKLATDNGRADRLAKEERVVDEKIRELYTVAFSRSPNEDELKTATGFLSESRVDAEGKPVDPSLVAKNNYQDLLWALINTKEFLFNH